MRILIVDDDYAMQKLTARLLKSLGAESVSASNGKDAKERLQQYEIDYAIVDINLGDENGTALAIELKKIDPSLRIIMISGDPTNDILVREAGLGILLAKPFSRNQIKKCLFD